MTEERQIEVKSRRIKQIYQVIDEVGSGTYGRVYKALDTRTREYVALKKMESSDTKII
jgi:serine/threonine protein kinase